MPIQSDKIHFTQKMISVKEAKEIIKSSTRVLKPQLLSLENAVGNTLANDVIAPFHIPAFPQSAMDGYAFSFEQWKENSKLQIEGESAAGSQKEIQLAKGKAIRIFTGAPVPHGADTVVMQEKVKIENNFLLLEDENISIGKNVRPEGSEIQKGELALEKNSILSPAAIGFLAGIGVSEVEVFPNPRISIIVTGNELQPAGKTLAYGEVYESNGITLATALQHLNINAIQTYRVADDLNLLIAILSEALQKSDMVLFTGGISAGDYDFVLEACNRCGVQKGFHKVAQKPGKPLYFGKKDHQLIFGLPGNPSAVLTCFYEYVLLALSIQTNKSLELSSLEVTLSEAFNKTAALTHFLKAYYDGHSVKALNAQESYRLSSFAKANCLLKLEPEKMDSSIGDIVEIHLLPKY